MEDRSVSSRGDPFGFRRPQTESKTTNSSETTSRHPSSPSSRLGRYAHSHGEVHVGDSSPLDSDKLYPHKSSTRLTIDTTAVITEDGGREESMLTTPNSNAASPDFTVPQLQQDDTGGFPPRNIINRQSPDMRPINLSHISPQHTVLSQLSASPIGQENEDDRVHAHAHHHQEHRSSVSTSFRSRRLSTMSNTAAQQRQLLQQKITTQLQDQVQQSQDDLARQQTELRQVQTVCQESQRVTVQLQQERDSWRLQFKELSEKKATEQEKLAADLERKSLELQEWRATLEQEAVSVQEKKETVAKQQAEWMELQKSVQQLETTQQHDQEVLQEFDEELNQKELDLEHAKQRWDAAKREQEHTWQQEQQDFATSRTQLKSWQGELQAQAENLQARKDQVISREEGVRRAHEELIVEKSDLEVAHQELERRDASCEAKYALTEQALEELAIQRQAEEQKLHAAVQNQREVAAESERIVFDSETVTHALHEKLVKAHAEYTGLLETIDDKNTELEDLKTRVKVFVLEDRKGRQVAAEQAKEAARQLETIRVEAQSARTERNTMVQYVMEQTNKYETLTCRIKEETQRWNSEKQTRLDQQQLHFKSAQDKFMGGLDKLSADMTTKSESIASELNAKTLKIEALQVSLSAIAEKYQRDVAELEREKASCATLREELNTRVAHFASSEGRQKRMREELEWEIERLKALIEAERRDFETRMSVGDDDLESSRQQHRAELTTLAETLSSAEAERDAVTIELGLLGAQVETREKELSFERERLFREKQSLLGQKDALVDEKRSLQERLDSLGGETQLLQQRYDSIATDKRMLVAELVLASDRTKESETLLLQHRSEKLAENEGREKMKLLVDHLEKQSAAADAKEDEARKQHAALRLAEDECQGKLAELDTKERCLSSKMTDIQGRENRLATLTLQRQKDALTTCLDRPLRQDSEAVSAAFSKWVRVTMFQLDDEKDAKANETNQGFQRQLDDCSIAFKEREKLLENGQREVVTQLEESKHIEQNLRDQLSHLQSERQTLAGEVRALKTCSASENYGFSDRLLSADERLKKVVSSLGDRESVVQRKEKSLCSRKEELDSAHNRVRSMADKLQQKERDLVARETTLSSDLAVCEITQSRLQKLARELQKKAEHLARDHTRTTNRMEDCDTLESQLQKWQTQLESLQVDHPN